MRKGWEIVIVAAVVAGLAGLAPGADDGAAAARKLLQAAVAQARHGDWDQAYALASEAADAQPLDTDYRTLRETFRQRATLDHLERAHALEAGGQALSAAVEYRAALALTPANLDAQQGLAAVFSSRLPAASTTGDLGLRVKELQQPARLTFDTRPHDLSLQGDIRAVLGQLAKIYGFKVYVADSLRPQAVNLTINQASFAAAMRTLRVLAGVDYIPVDAHTAYFGDAKVLEPLQPYGERTFYLSQVHDVGGLAEIALAVRNTLGIQQIQADAQHAALTMRATVAQLDAAERMLLDLDHAPGEVLLDVRIVEMDDNDALQLGLQEPDQFNLFTLGPLLAQLSQNSSLEQNILNLFNSGGLNAVLNSGQLNPSELQQAESTLSPLLQNPFVVFGGGATLMALSLPSPSLNLGLNQSHTATVERALVRASVNQPAELKVGERYPIVNAVFSPISLSPAIQSVIGNLSYTQPFPSFTYEDLGVDAKLTPKQLNDRGDINLGVQITVKGLTGQSSNGLPILTNRVLTSQIDLKNGEPALLAGMLDQEDTSTLAGLPGLGTLPGLGALFSSRNNQTTKERLMLLITPHVVLETEPQTEVVWLPPGFAPAIAAAAGPSFFPGLTPPPPPPPAAPIEPGQNGGPPAGQPVAPQPLTAPVTPGGRGGGE